MTNGPQAERRGPDGSRQRAAAWGALAFGLVAGSLVAGGVVMRLPGALVVSDPREVVVSLGGALCGPLAGAFIGFCAGIFERIPNVALPSAIGHAAAGIWMGWAYRRIARSELCRRQPMALGMAWAGALVVYYAGVLYPTALLASVVLPWLGLQPSIWTDPVHAAVGPVKALPLVLRDAAYEFGATLLTTTAIWSVLPRHQRQPLLERGMALPTGPEDLPAAARASAPSWRPSTTLTRWLVAAAAGVGAALTIGTGLQLTMPGSNLVIDPRQTFVTLGAALCGPGPAVLVGLLAGAMEWVPGTQVPSMITHACAAVGMAYMYRGLVARHADDRRLWPFVLGWVGRLALYYTLLLVPISMLWGLLWPDLMAGVMGQPGLDGPALGLIALASVWEFAVTALLTAAALCVLPRRARLPIGM